MYHPTKEEFIRRSAQGNLIPVYREVLADMETPVSAYRKIARGKYSFLLESVEGGERMARYSFLGTDPFLVMKSKGREVQTVERWRADKVQLKDGEDPLHVLEKLLARYNYVDDPELPRFCGGAVGYIGYDTVRFFENLPDTTVDDLEVPDALFLLTDILLVFDHVKHRIKVVCTPEVGSDPATTYALACEKIDEVVGRLHQPLPAVTPKESKGKALKPVSNMTKGQYEKMVEAAKEYIKAGDIIQIVPSQRLSVPLQADPFDVYRALRSVNPSPYMYYLNYDDLKLIGSSPEILVTEERGEVTTRPIAGHAATREDRGRGSGAREGTAGGREGARRAHHARRPRPERHRPCLQVRHRRGRSTDGDRALFARDAHRLERPRRTRRRKDQFDVLRATFPAGTVSGAPKIRAMEIIDELEPTRRGTYAGAIGYFSFSGNMDTCITIRTILVKDGMAYMQAGGGVVADSVPENEYQETHEQGRSDAEGHRACPAGIGLEHRFHGSEHR